MNDDGFHLLGKSMIGKTTIFIYRGKDAFLTGDYCIRRGEAYMDNANLDLFSVMIWRKFEHEAPLSYRKSVYYVE